MGDPSCLMLHEAGSPKGRSGTVAVMAASSEL
jgi:hypothetical protein